MAPPNSSSFSSSRVAKKQKNQKAKARFCPCVAQVFIYCNKGNTVALFI